MRFASLAQKYARKANALYQRVMLLSAMPKPQERAALPPFYTVAGRSLPLRFVPHSRARRLTLRLEPGGCGLRVTAPPHAANDEMMRFVRRHHGWLEKKLAALPAPGAADAPAVRNGGFIPFLGAPHRIIHCAGRGLTQCAEQGGEKQILVYGQEQFLPRHIRDFLKKQAELVLRPMVEKHAAALERKPKSISYKDTKTRWGSCSSEQKLCFSWRIVMAPAEVADYLAAHEVAHLAEMNHSPRFWALCEKLCPQTAQHRAWLKDNGQTLLALQFD